MATKTVRRSISMTPEMHSLLTQIVARRGRDFTEADLIREAIRLYLDNESAIVGSRRHFQKSFQTRLDQLESSLTFQLHVLTYLLAAALDDADGRAIKEAIVSARRDGDRLKAQIAAVRGLKDDG